MSIKDKPEARYGLWQAYQRRCAVCLEELFNYSDLEIDHIISEKTFKDHQKTTDVIKKFNLPTTFDFNHLENLRPAHRKCNNEKRDTELPDEIVARLLRRAQKKLKDVRKHIRKFEEEAQYALSIEAIRKQLAEGKITAEEYTDRINNYVADFGVDEKSHTFDKKYLEYRNRTVMLEGILPALGESRGSCLFTFNSFYIRGTTINLGHKDILSELYPGNNTPIDFEMRRYVVAKLDENNYMVQLGNSRFNLSDEELGNLCAVIDKFIVEYIEAIRLTEEILDCREFIPNHYHPDEYHLIKVSMDVWRKILKFSREYDYGKGDSDWHIFDATGNNILKIYMKKANEDHNEGFKCIIHSFIEDHYSWTPSDKVWLLWNKSGLSKKYGPRDYWTVSNAYAWLTKKLLPRVMQEDNAAQTKGFFKKIQLNHIDVTDYYSDGEVRYFNLNYIINASQLITLVNELQLFYSKNEYVCMNKSELIKLYKGILKSINSCKKPQYHYICSKLGIDQTESKEDIRSFINHKIEHYTHLSGNSEGLVKIYSHQIDDLFRVLYANLQDMEFELDIREIKDYLVLMDWFIQDFNTTRLVECYK
ncbi:HNH endonuclease [Cohnella hashimotonis]|uniref:HNH endonuclease signature motif containing protein n=1 Tax=Cohnella hashimotonis TaxID=2826895 RepID=A0ABT6TS02_9BACL|nr:HNH endonuclease signature motif containing protein [Cohnella hashimotonis]MDI4649608.1 HNH endonuclease signature motif containing protein [Cohnella hashimotonis]